MARVNVRIEWPDDLRALPEHAQARVTVEDVTRADASSVVIAESVLGDLVSTQSHPVLTRGHGDSVVVRPRVVGS